MPTPTGRKDSNEQVEKLTYNTREACKALGVSASTLRRMELKGLVAPVRSLGIKLYSVEAIRRFIEGGAGT